MNPQRVRGTQANSQVRFGILGCGGRGHAVGTGFVENAGARVTALADLFGDKLEAAQQHYDQIQQAKGYAAIDSAQLFKGPDAYQRIAASNAVDFILITTPPYFHPHHLETVVDAGKHVYCEKPVAVDVPNAHHVIQIGKKAEEKLSLDVGFQIRMAPPMVELTRRLHDGAIGKVGCGTGVLLLRAHRPAGMGRSLARGEATEELGVGSHISPATSSSSRTSTSSTCATGCCKGHPEKATGTGSRKLRTDTGDCWDNFNVLFTYPGDVQISFGSCQVGHPEFDAAVRLFGTEGSSAAHYDWRVNIAGDNKWDSGLGPDKGAEQFSVTGKFKGSLDQADPEKQRAFVASITSGQFHNQAALGAESAMSAMLGRTAAYKGRLGHLGRTTEVEGSIRSRRSISPNSRDYGCRQSLGVTLKHSFFASRFSEDIRWGLRAWPPSLRLASAAIADPALPAPGADRSHIKKAVQINMLPKQLSYADRFKLARDVGFENVEGQTVTDPRAKPRRSSKAADDAKVHIHSVMNMAHWEYPLSSSDPAVVAKSLDGMKTSLHNAKLWGAGAVLLVPAVVNPETSYQEAWTRSQKQIRTLIPLAEELQGGHRDRGSVEQVPAEPAGDGAIRRRVPEPLDQVLLRRRQRGALRLSAGLDSHARPAHRQGAPEGLQAQSQEGNWQWKNLGEGDIDWAAVRKPSPTWATPATQPPNFQPVTRPTCVT